MLRQFLLAIAIALAGVTAALADPSLSVDGAFARPTIGQQRVSAAYMTIHNKGDADRLLRASSPVAAKVELHTHMRDGDVMKMRQVPSIDVPAHGMATLAPGGFHIMLIDLKAPLAMGEKVPLTLEFEKAGRIEVEAPVQRPSAGGETKPMHKH